MADNTKSVSDQPKVTNDDVEVKSEPLGKQSPSGNTQKPRSNGSSSTTQQKKQQTDSYAQKRKQSVQEDSVSKKPRASISYQANAEDSFTDDEEYYMTLLDIPINFQITNYLKECGITEVVDVIKNNKRNVQLNFKNGSDRGKTLHKLSDEGIKNNIVYSKLLEAETEINDSASDTTEIITHRPWRPSEDIWETDPSGLYGLKPEFLTALNITPPLGRWVHVTNFRCDKFELRDVMELAGHVLSCSVINIKKRFAKVQFSHPLEAVQAVSMLNGQLYFGLKLKVYIEKNPKNDIILPKGLLNIGLGLGLQGRPIRDVVSQYQKYAKQQISAVNPIFFRKIILNEQELDKDKDVANLDEKEIDFSQFMASTKTEEFINERSFHVRHVEDLQSIDGDSSEKDSVKRSMSPDTNSLKSVDLSRDTLKKEEGEKADDSQPVRLSAFTPHVGAINPGQPIPGRSVQEPMMPQDPGQPLAPGTFHAAPVAQFISRMFPGRMNRISNAMRNPIGNQPHSFGPVHAFRPQMQGPIGSVPMHAGRPVPGPVQRPGAVVGSGTRPGPAPGHIWAPTGPVIGPTRPDNKVVHFSNLPMSTTFPFFCEKLSHFGHVVSLQFTTPGCAIATFDHPSQAERCIHNFNGRTVDGYRIMASYM